MRSAIAGRRGYALEGTLDAVVFSGFRRRKNVRIAFVVGMLVALVALCSVGMTAQPGGLPPVPAGLSPQQTGTLSKDRARIVEEGDKLQTSVENHHAKCAHIGLPLPSGQTPDPNEAALKEQCDAEQAAIDKQVKQYAADAVVYRKAVETAVAATAGAQNAYAARVVLKGTVHLLQPGGEIALTSSRVVRLTTGERITTAPHARASFQLPDKSEFVLGPDSIVVLKAMVNGATPAQRRITLKVTKGVLHWKSGDNASARAENIDIEIPPGSVSLGVCDVQAAIMSPDGGGYVALFKGKARIVADKKGSSTIVLEPNQIATYTTAGMFSPVRPMQPQEIRTP